MDKLGIAGGEGALAARNELRRFAGAAQADRAAGRS